MKNNHIYITGGSYWNLEKALSQWINSHYKSLNPNYRFDIHTVKHDQYIISIDEKVRK